MDEHYSGHYCEICDCEIDHIGYCDDCVKLFGLDACPYCGGETDIAGRLCADCDSRLLRSDMGV